MIAGSLLTYLVILFKSQRARRIKKCSLEGKYGRGLEKNSLVWFLDKPINIDGTASILSVFSDFLNDTLCLTVLIKNLLSTQDKIEVF